MTAQHTPIACDLSRLSDTQRRREQELLRKFRARWAREAETDDGVWLSMPADPDELADLGELLGLERLCCPFLKFQLEVTREERCRLYIVGPPGARGFVLMEFTE
ncbi:MAG TPA: hypothetical protein VFR03_01750 [Thermoanaerobaculia bacterium]|nr:hypothetical protein [Thermoanaerobaculia bacterium]